MLGNYCFCAKKDFKIAKLHLKQTPANFGHCRWECKQHSKRLKVTKQIKTDQCNSQRIIQKYPNSLDTQTHTGCPESKAIAQLPTTVSNTIWTKQSQHTAEIKNNRNNRASTRQQMKFSRIRSDSGYTRNDEKDKQQFLKRIFQIEHNTVLDKKTIQHVPR